jgi:predicted AlkP superfamily phosphohydrolase/phosphomutase
MKRPVLAIAIDGAGPETVERWIASGATPTLARLRAEGAWGRLRTPLDRPYESVWDVFLRGATRVPGEAPPGVPFYALPQARVAIFDVPLAPLLGSLGGIQLLGWGMEQNEATSGSEPRELLAEVIRRHGPHPVFGGAAARVLQRDGRSVTSYRLPSVYDLEALGAFRERVLAAIERRAAIASEILRRGPWDFLLMTGAEWHVAAHMLWHLSEPHPLHAAMPRSGPDPLAQVARALDASLGAMLEAAPEDACLVVFSLSGMSANHADLPNFLFLPEFLHRLYFGAPALAAGETGHPPPPPVHYRGHWKDEIWSLRTDRGEAALESPAAQERRGDPFDWSPLNWYRPLWPGMPAYALPGFTEGRIRLNVKRGDGSGVVAAAECSRVSEELAAALRALVNARSRKPLVREIARAPRPEDRDSAPDDLLVRWNVEEVTDVVESPAVGRIGPVPYLRTGGHAHDGFCIARGPGIAPGSRLPEEARVTDLTVTLIGLMGGLPPDAMQERRLWR